MSLFGVGNPFSTQVGQKIGKCAFICICHVIAYSVFIVSLKFIPRDIRESIAINENLQIRTRDAISPFILTNLFNYGRQRYPIKYSE